jgi:hypothetical protein
MPRFRCFDALDCHRNDLLEDVSQPLGICVHAAGDPEAGELCRGSPSFVSL